MEEESYSANRVVTSIIHDETVMIVQKEERRHVGGSIKGVMNTTVQFPVQPEKGK
jgi:DNA polymerase I-like protein with 3'-5' exonuclease and polymerase domains